jgi:hypothetical protein
MSIIDRHAKVNAPQQSAPAKPQENAKQAGTRKEAEDRASRPAVESLPANVKEAARDAGSGTRKLLDRWTEYKSQSAGNIESHTDSKDGHGSKGALVHKETAPGKEQTPLSPTDGSKGNTSSKDSPSPTPSGPSRGPSRGR